MSIRFIRSSWVAKFTFDLDPVSVERIDVLESKLRDQQEELERLRGMVDGGDTPLLVKLEATTKTNNSNVNWGKIESDDFIVTGDDGVVKVVHPGLYHVGSIVNCAPGNHNRSVQLLKNGECILWCYCGYANGNCASTALDTIVRVENNDELTISCDCNVSGTSYLTLAKLAK
ncbi:hypothetical protein PHYPSEUDO_001190 [Phytophthora pseudosyringae]|uniref:Uncharacterized protein n=1 Tax=Phytophthora pseudosyringae TaxID=221518 RepID=A0A8T1V563_9STRA|nr:hypothetical protein PHYPSEUDO_001190 [Phytophthora pseudosyringae]